MKASHEGQREANCGTWTHTTGVSGKELLEYWLWGSWLFRHQAEELPVFETLLLHLCLALSKTISSVVSAPRISRTSRSTTETVMVINHSEISALSRGLLTGVVMVVVEGAGVELGSGGELCMLLHSVRGTAHRGPNVKKLVRSGQTVRWS